jgi:hypothetical protein
MDHSLGLRDKQNAAGCERKSEGFGPDALIGVDAGHRMEG